jgi:hypothetical protein
MGCLGVHFALTVEQVARLDTCCNDQQLMAFIEEIERLWDKEWLQETDKAWDAIHRCLTNGKLEHGRSPKHNCILGRDSLHEGPSYIACFLEPEEIKEVAEAVKDIDRDWFRRKYDAIDTSSYQDTLSDSDFEYTWRWFVLLREFFQKVAGANRAMLFTAPQ